LSVDPVGVKEAVWDVIIPDLVIPGYLAGVIDPARRCGGGPGEFDVSKLAVAIEVALDGQGAVFIIPDDLAGVIDPPCFGDFSPWNGDAGEGAAAIEEAIGIFGLIIITPTICPKLLMPKA
jgi:hypothetical protein